MLKILRLRLKNMLQRVLDKDCTMSRVNIWDMEGNAKKEKRDIKNLLRTIKRNVYCLELLVDKENKGKQNQIYEVMSYFVKKFIKNTKGMLVLYKKGFYAEAIMVAGYLLEGLVSFLYLVRTKRVQDYIDYKYFQYAKYFFITLIAHEKELGRHVKQNALTIKKYGKKFIKKGKKHKEVVKQLLSTEVSSEEKSKLLIKYYHDYWFKDTINSTMKKMNIPREMRFFYSVYSSTRHYNEADIYYCEFCKKYAYMPPSRLHKKMALYTVSAVLRIVKLEYKKMGITKKILRDINNEKDK